MELKNINKHVKPVLIITFSLLISALMIGMIAYANCEEAKLFIDNFMGKEVIHPTLGQA